MPRPVVLAQTGVGTTPWLRINYRAVDPKFTAQFVLSGTATFSGEFTLDDPPNNVFTDAAVNAATASTYSTWNSPVQYYRLNVTSGTGTVTMTVVQGGPG